MTIAWKMLWQLEDKVWARRSWREIIAGNRRPPEGIEERRVAFGPDPRQHLFWYRPAGPSARRTNLIFFIHGGGWRSGSPAYHRFVGRTFATRGYTAVVAGYRLLPRHTLPEMLQDLVDALRMGIALHQEQGRRGGVVIVGQSAGAHLGALLAFGGAESFGCGGVGADIGGFVSLGGVLDFAVARRAGFGRLVQELVGAQGNPALADPMRYVTRRAEVPILCVHGARDYAVDPEQSRSFVQRANEGGDRRSPAEVLIVPHAHHADLIELLFRPSTAATRLLAWIDSRESQPALRRHQAAG